MLLALDLVGNLRHGRFQHRHDWHALGVGGGDAFEVRPDAAQLRVNERVDEMQVSIEPGKQAVLDLVMDRDRDLGAVRPDLGEIDQADDFDITAG